MRALVFFVLGFVLVAPAIAIAGSAAGSPWFEVSLVLSGLLVGGVSWNGIRAIMAGSDLPWHKRSGIQMRLIAGLALVAATGILLAAGALVYLLIDLSR